MSNEATAEAQALLTKVAPKGKITNGADAYLFDMRGPALMSELVAEVGRLREALTTLRHHLQKQPDVVRLIDAALSGKKEGG